MLRQEFQQACASIVALLIAIRNLNICGATSACLVWRRSSDSCSLHSRDAALVGRNVVFDFSKGTHFWKPPAMPD